MKGGRGDQMSDQHHVGGLKFVVRSVIKNMKGNRKTDEKTL